MTYMCPGREIAHSDTFPALGSFPFPWSPFRRTVQSRFAQLDIIPSSLRSRKVKVLPAAWKVRPHLHSLTVHMYVTMEELLFLYFEFDYRIRLNRTPSWIEPHPLKNHAKMQFLCVFYVTIWGQKPILKNRTPGLHSSGYGISNLNTDLKSLCHSKI